MPPGPLLTSVVHAPAGETAEGLAALSDDQLIGIISTRRLESRIAWTQLAAMAEFAALAAGRIHPRCTPGSSKTRRACCPRPTPPAR
jgi:hypothetical protein